MQKSIFSKGCQEIFRLARVFLVYLSPQKNSRVVENIQIYMIILDWIFLCYSPIIILKVADSKMIMTEL